MLSNPPDDVVYFARYYAYPRPVLKFTSAPDPTGMFQPIPAGRRPVYFSAFDSTAGRWTLVPARAASAGEGVER